MRANTCQPGSGKKDLKRLAYLAELLLRFDLNSELELLRQEESWDRETGCSPKALANYSDFQIVLASMKAGRHMNDHRAEVRISIQALEGTILLHVADQKLIELSADKSMALDCAVHHEVEALEESAFLLMIAWWKGESSPTEKQATHSLSAKREHRRAIESHELEPHKGEVDDRPQAEDYSDRSLEKFACEHQLPPRWLELRKACNRLVARSDFWYRSELIDRARQLAREASEILETVLRQGKRLVQEELRTGEPLATLRQGSGILVGEHRYSA